MGEQEPIRTPPGLRWHSSLPAAASEHMKLIGAVVSEWAQVEYLAFALFMKLSRMPLLEAEAVFFAIRSGRTRLELVEGLLLAIFPDEEARKPINVVHNRMRILAKRRNDFAHKLIMGWSGDGKNIVQMNPRQTPTLDVKEVSLDALN